MRYLLALIILLQAAFAWAADGYLLQQSSTNAPLVFLMIDSSDHISAKTGLSPTVTLSKAGAAFGSPTGSVTEIGSGWYKVAGNATDTATLGPLVLHATGSGADPVDIIYNVVGFDPQVANLAANVKQWNTTTVATPATAGIPDVNAKNINNVSTSSVTTINANVGTTQPANFTGTGASALVKTDAIDLAGQAITAAAGVTFPSSVASPTNITAATGITVSTNSDKTGYALSSGGVQAIWDALTSALTTTGSIGKRLADDIDGTITSRMASYTQPTGFLAATFPSGTVANTTNITAGTITTVGTTTTVTNDVGITQAAADKVWSTTTRALTDKANFTLVVTPPTAATIATTVWQDLTSGSDFSTTSSIGKLLKDNVDATISSRLATSGYTAPTNLTAAQIATGVWRSTTASDFNLASSIGNALYVNAAPGAISGGFPIVGTGQGAISLASGQVVASSVAGDVQGAVIGNVGGVAANGITTASFNAGATLPRVTLADTITTYTGNTKQTGDSYPVVTNATYGNAFLYDILHDLSVRTPVALVSGQMASRITSVDSTQLQVIAGAIWDLATSGHTTSGTFGAAAVAGSAPTAAQNAAAVWDLNTSGHTTAGTFGKKLSDAGAASDPWSVAVPDVYAIGTAGEKLGNLLANLSNKTVTVTNPVAATKLVTIVAGDTYSAAIGRALTWTVKNYTGPDVTTLTVSFRVAEVSDPTTALLTTSGSVTMSGADAIFSVDLTAAQTQALQATDYTYRLQAVDTSNRVITEVLSNMTVKKAP